MFSAWLFSTVQGRLSVVILWAVLAGFYFAQGHLLTTACAVLFGVLEVRDFVRWWERDRAAATTEAAQIAVQADRFTRGVFDQDA